MANGLPNYICIFRLWRKNDKKISLCTCVRLPKIPFVPPKPEVQINWLNDVSRWICFNKIVRIKGGILKFREYTSNVEEDEGYVTRTQFFFQNRIFHFYKCSRHSSLCMQFTVPIILFPYNLNEKASLGFCE